MKPVRGGRPPSESRIRGVKEVMTGVLVQEIANELTFVALLILKTRKVEKVMTK